VAVKRTLGAVLGAVMLAALASGCGGSRSKAEQVTVAPTAAAMRAAATATAGKGTAHVEFTMSMNTAGHDVNLRGSGGSDPANHRTVLTFDMKELFDALPMASIPVEMRDALDEPMTVMLDGTVMYMRFPLLTRVLPGSKEWVKVDLSESSGLSSILGSNAGGAYGSDPSSVLQFLQGADSVTEVGSEEVRGEKTTHFSGSYTVEDAIAAAPESVRDEIEQAFDKLGMPESARTAEIPFDVWIGNDGLVRCMSMAFDVTKLAAADEVAPSTGETKMTMEFFDFGAPIDFSPPSDDEVTDMTSLVPQSFFS